MSLRDDPAAANHANPTGLIWSVPTEQIECPICRVYRVERQFWVTAHFKKARQPVLYRRLARWLEERGEGGDPPEIPFEGWERLAAALPPAREA